MVVAVAAFAVLRRERLAAWLRPVPAMRAGLIGAVVATAVGTLANDSGALLLEIGVAYLLVFIAWAWAERPAEESRNRGTVQAIIYPVSLVRIALVSPYSWSYQGGVNRHVEALAEEFLGRGHHVRVLAPFDPPGRLSRAFTAPPPEPREAPDYLVPLGRTAGLRRQRRRLQPRAFPGRRRRSPPAASCARGDYDVVHVHEPLAPLVGWNATLRRPLPGSRHLPRLLDQGVPNHIASVLGARRVFNHLSARIAVSEAAAWTGRRWFGGDYEIVPNGVDLEAAPQASRSRRATSSASSSSAAPRSARGCRSCSPPSRHWSSMFPAA